jgi:hypothetical protein
MKSTMIIALISMLSGHGIQVDTEPQPASIGFVTLVPKQGIAPRLFGETKFAPKVQDMILQLTQDAGITCYVGDYSITIQA